MAAARKGSLIGAVKAAKDQVEAETATATAAASWSTVNGASEEMVTTAVHIPKAVLSLLRRVAVERANLQGGRPSVSGVITDLVERHRAELEEEARRG